MKVLVFVKATPNSEQGIKPEQDLTKLFADMGKFNDKLVKAGIMKEADGLKPSSFGKRLTFSDAGHTGVFDGPFVDTKELVAGYWVWEVKSMDEAVKWAKQCPNPMPGEEGVLEIRPTYALEDFGDLVSKEDMGAEQRRRRELKRKPRAKSKPRTRKPTRAKSKK
jgi:hypothetical protein